MTRIPANTPVPENDGACRHLTGASFPDVELVSTSRAGVNLAGQSGLVVLYCYPRTGHPGRPSPEGWAQIPGALGCTPQACAFRDHYGEMADLGARVFGVSTQSPEDQREARERLNIPYELLSDEPLAFARALQLPTFSVDGATLHRRVTLIARDGRIEKVFYPVFPPDDHVYEVLDWLKAGIA
ncbi:peroxiredoxin [Marinobacter oulmenensis]|uniref:Peroxiredoxin n=1 Tax=Marinobacter oulmenensis TaxID=643747 RepID=A0A840UP36_9GAMM|nr:peroxiredoxin [Marinobacter oulmenensis]MBB5322388.1 peroxiredoxin [Marinobacter oulmenensis]